MTAKGVTTQLAAHGAPGPQPGFSKAEAQAKGRTVVPSTEAGQDLSTW